MTLTKQEYRAVHAFVTNGDESTGPYPYDIQPHFDNLLRVLFGQEEMWDDFAEGYAYNEWVRIGKPIDFYPWLFHPDHRDRFCRLFIDWLRLEEVQREFGYTECPCPPEFKGDKEIIRVCPYCNGTGKVMRPWLRVMKEAQ